MKTTKKVCLCCIYICIWMDHKTVGSWWRPKRQYESPDRRYLRQTKLVQNEHTFYLYFMNVTAAICNRSYVRTQSIKRKHCSNLSFLFSICRVPYQFNFSFFFFNLAFFVQFSYFLIFLFYIFLFCSVYDRKTVACVYRRRTEKCRGLNRFLLVYNKKKEKACKLIYQIYVTYILIYLIQHYTWQRGVLYDLETIC